MSRIYKNNEYESEELEEPMLLPVTLDDGTEVECEVLAIFPVKNLPDGEAERQYIALLPLSDELSDIFLYRFVPVGSEESEEVDVEVIEDDEEYQAVTDVFDMLLDDAEFDSMMEEE